jgi:CRISPR-associated protein Cmr2
MNVYALKLYAILRSINIAEVESSILERIPCLSNELDELKAQGILEQVSLIEEIASSSDRINLEVGNRAGGNTVKHPISGEERLVSPLPELTKDIGIGDRFAEETDLEKVFWWFWRFYPEIIRERQPAGQQDFFLYPAHPILPDCPLHSYKSTVSALLGAMYPNNTESEATERPYIFLFTFSPVQEFIKASRKFLDFWAGSYLLHYLGAKICWKIAELYGPDAVITPSLWSQEIIDAFIVQKYRDFAIDFACLQDGRDPVDRFNEGISTSLSTAGFPNVITALVPGKEAARKLGEDLRKYLIQEWSEIALKVREDLKNRTIEFLKNPENDDKITEILTEFSDNKEIQEACQRDLGKWIKGNSGSCWEWKKLWEAQIEQTWETYWTAVPLGNPERLLKIKPAEPDYQKWKQDQNAIAPPHLTESLPTKAEENIYAQVNVGTWWGALQTRLGQSIQAVKNTRTWAIPTAPGERSTLSGQFSAVHPQLHYHEWRKDGFGISERSMRLFWRLMAEVYPGLFNGSEKLNAIELTKRMAWGYGGIAASLGINLGLESEMEGRGDPNYEGLIRFPNLSSIAAARFSRSKSHFETSDSEQ